MGQMELAGADAGLAPGLDQRAVALEAVDAGVAVAVADVQLSVRSHGDVGRPVEWRAAALDTADGLSVIAGIRTFSGDAEHHHLFPLEGELPHRVVPIIHCVHHVFRDGDPVGARREQTLAPRADEVALPIVHDDPGILAGHEIHVVLGVDRHAVHVLMDVPLGELLPPFDHFELRNNRHDPASPFAFCIAVTCRPPLSTIQPGDIIRGFGTRTLSVFSGQPDLRTARPLLSGSPSFPASLDGASGSVGEKKRPS